jgi:Coenzyme PQQ synthesis protein D (PqqD)
MMTNAMQASSILSTPLRPALGVRLFLTEDDGILFDEVGQKIFHLNRTATFIWCHVEERQPIEAIIESTVACMRLDQVQAHQFVLKMIRAWWRLGLLDGSRHRAPVVRRSASARFSMPRPAADLRRDFLPQVEARQYRLIDTRFSLEYSDRKLEELVHPILAHLEVPRPETAALQLAVVDIGEEWRVLQGTTVLGSCGNLDNLAPMVQGIVSMLAIRRHRFVFALHAGGVALDDKAMLLVGRSRSGKTTLTAALLALGWDYLSDDMILMERDSLEALAMPCSLGIKRGGWELLAARFPKLAPPRTHLRADGEVVSYLSPPSSRRSFYAPRPVRWIVFPNLSPDTRGSLRPLPRLEGLQRLMRHCCGIPSALISSDIRRLIEWSQAISWFEMSVSDLDTAMARLTRITTAERVAAGQEAREAG